MRGIVEVTTASEPQIVRGGRTCPACRRYSVRTLRFVVREQQITCCSVCGHTQIDVVVAHDHIARVYDDNYFTAGGGGYADYLDEAELLRRRGARYAELLTRYGRPARLLDVGSAAGFIAAGFASAAWNVTAIDPNPAMVQYARDVVGIDAHSETLETFAERTTERFDALVMIQIAGHLVDPERAFRCAAKLTAPGGLWLIETWNASSWTARLLGRSWHEYNPPSVLQIFTPASLRAFAARQGFHELGCGRPHKAISAAHAKALLRAKMHEGRAIALAAQVARFVPDEITLPYPADDLFYSFFRRPA